MTLLVLKTDYEISFDEWCKLEEMQDWFRETSQSILVDCKFNKGDYLLRKHQLASRIRSKWEVLEGGKKEETTLAG